MKKSMFFTFVLAILAVAVRAQETNQVPTHPPFVPPVREEAKTNPPVNLLRAVREAFPNIWKEETNSASVAVPTSPRTNVYDRLGMVWPVETNAAVAPIFSLQSQEEREKKGKAEKAARLLALNERVQAERRAATRVAVTDNQTNNQQVLSKVVSKTNVPPPVSPPATNALAKTLKPKKADKNAPPQVFIAPDSVTDYVAPPKEAPTFSYKQEVLVPQTPEEVDARNHAIARLMGTEQGVWSAGSTQTPNGSRDYVVDQRPLDQGTQPASVEYYPTYQSGYVTAVPVYPRQPAYPMYAEQGSYYPVAHYATYGYYPTYGYTYGVGYDSPRRLFGVSFDAVVSSSFSYSPGWSVRANRGHSQRQPATYQTYRSGGGPRHRGGGR